MAKVPRNPHKARTALLPAAASEDRSVHGGLALALINTETMNRGKILDALTSPDALAQWWAEASARCPEQCVIEGAAEPIAWTDDLLDAVRALRMTLRSLATHVVEQHAVKDEDLKPLNDILELGYAALERTEAGHVKAVTYLRDPQKGSILLPIALSAVQLFAESDWRRLHDCKSDRCIVFFYDTTKSATRRWCSPDCMNRARSIQHYRQTKTFPTSADASV